MFSKPRLATFLIAGAGLAGFWLLGLPLPFLFGPMTGCMVAALLGVKVQGTGLAGVAAQTILGVAVGASVTPALLGQVPVMAVTLAMIPVFVGLIAAVGVPFFARFAGLDRTTGFYAAMPGGLQDMVLFGIEAGGNARALALIHATRVLLVVCLVPVILVWFFDVTLSTPPGAPVSSLPPGQVLLMGAAAAVGWWGAARLGVFGAAILGPMVVAAALSLGGFLLHRPPAEAVNFAQVLIGMGISVYFTGITAAELVRYVASGAVFAVFLSLMSGGFALMAWAFGGAAPMEAFLSFSPGGQAEIALLAIVAGADVGFIVLHHILRIVLAIVGAPLVARFFLRG